MDGSETDSTYGLLQKSMRGDRAATELLCGRLRPRLRRWARGRLPVWTRDGIDTDDLVQEALMITLAETGHLEARPDFQGYIRQVIVNAIRDRVRRAARKKRAAGEFDRNHHASPSPLEELIGRERLARFEAALKRLSAQDREMIVCRVELGMSYREISDVTGRPTADAARMAVARALVRLSVELDREP